MPTGVYERTPESRRKMSAALKGRVFSEEHRRKLSEGNKRRTVSTEHRRNMSLAAGGTGTPGYDASHKQVERLRGKPSFCLFCRHPGQKRYDWASISDNFTDPEDYIRLCRSCHMKWDRAGRPLDRLPLGWVQLMIGHS